MNRLLVLGALGLVLPGCLSGSPDGGDGRIETSDAPPILDEALDLRPATPLAPVFVATREGGAEPGILQAPDGTWYAATPMVIWRSEDDGKTWVQAKATNLTGGGDADLAVDAKGRLYWTGLGGEAGGPIPFQTSDDQGDTWTEAIDLSHGLGFDRQWIDVTSDGHVFTNWRGDGGVQFRHSPDGGATWDPLVNITTDRISGPIAHDLEGRIFIAIADFNDSPSTTEPLLYVVTSENYGKNWTSSVVATIHRTSPVEPNGYSTDFPVVAVDAAGTVYATWSADTQSLPNGLEAPEEAALYGVWLAVSKDHGTTWSEPVLISPDDRNSRFPWVAAGAPGRIAIAWYQSVRSIPGEMLPDEYHVIMWESVNADEDAIKSQIVQLTVEPNHLGSVCTSGTGCVAADRSLLDFFEVAIGQDGQPRAVWAASTVGTGIGLAVDGTHVYFGGLASGTPLR